MILRKSITFVLIISLIVLFPVSMLIPRDAVGNLKEVVDLVSLGDSIAYGSSVPTGQGYSDLFYAYLQSKPQLESAKLFNLSKPGAKSSDLLNELEGDGNVKGSMENARVVTVSIGGNNLLEPVIRSVATAYQIDPADLQLADKLGNLLKNDKDQNNTLLRSALSETLEAELNTGVAQFKANWPKIVGLIKTLAPDAQIDVLSVYNPFPQEDLLFSLFDPYVQKINDTIKAGKGYTTADIYTCFLQGAAQKPLNFDLLQGQTDPHPTKQGHKMIFQTLSALFDLANALHWESFGKVEVLPNKTWTIKFNMPLADSVEEFVQVYTATGLLVDVLVKPGGADSLVVESPLGGYPLGLYSLFIRNGLPAKSGQNLKGSVKMDFDVKS